MRNGKRLQLTGVLARLGVATETRFGHEALAPGAFRNGIDAAVAALWGEFVLSQARASTHRISELNGTMRYAIDLPAT